MLRDFFLASIALFIALDIVGTLPIYLGMTSGMKHEDRGRVLNVSMAVAFVVALVFAFLGNLIFRYLGITLFDFRIAGGLVLLLVSLAELVNQPEVVNRFSGSTGVVPLAVPLITGPAILTTLILQVNSLGYLITLAALLLNYLAAWAILRRSEWLTRLIGKDGTVVVSKVSSLLLAAIAVSMIRGGVFEAIQQFAGRP